VQIRRGTWDDFDAAYALIATPWSRPDHLRSQWALPSFDPARHLWFAEEDGRPLAYGALYMPDHAVVRGDAGQIPTLLAEIEREARSAQVDQLAFVIPEWDEPAWRAYMDYGFERTTTVLQMEADLSEVREQPAFPPDVAVRTYEENDADRVQRLLDEAYAAWDASYVPMAPDDWRAWMTGDPSFEPECWWLAEANGGLAGVCLTWKEGWLKDIATATAWRGRGVGKALLLHALAEHRRRGNRRVGLKVDDRNPTGAVQLYERCGFRVDRRFFALVKPL
jgi:ribosomal protein S18 acetylase RimI-like enzyme